MVGSPNHSVIYIPVGPMGVPHREHPRPRPASRALIAAPRCAPPPRPVRSPPPACPPASTCTPSAARRTGSTPRSCSAPSPRPATGWCRTRPRPTSSSSTPAASSRAPRRSRSRPSCELARMKEDGRCKKLVVTGCLAQRYAEELARELPEVDHFVGTGAYPDIASHRLRRAGEAGHRPRPRLRPLRHHARASTRWPATPPTSRSPRAATTPAPSASSPSCAAPQRSRTVDDVVAEAEAAGRPGHGGALAGGPGPDRLRPGPARQGAAPPPAPRALQGRGHPLDPAPLRLPARLPRRAHGGHRPRAQDREVPRHAAAALVATGCCAP